MYFDEFKHQLPDIDEAETEDWMTSLDQVVVEAVGRYASEVRSGAFPGPEHSVAAGDALREHLRARAG